MNSRRAPGAIIPTVAKPSSIRLGRCKPWSTLPPRNFAQLRSDLANVRGPAALGNQIQRIRTVFKFAFDADLIERPVRFGPTFRKPSRKFIHKALMANGTK